MLICQGNRKNSLGKPESRKTFLSKILIIFSLYIEGKEMEPEDYQKKLVFKLNKESKPTKGLTMLVK